MVEARQVDEAAEVFSSGRLTKPSVDNLVEERIKAVDRYKRRSMCMVCLDFFCELHRDAAVCGAIDVRLFYSMEFFSVRVKSGWD